MPDSQTGFRFEYSVEKTEDKGLGVFAREPIVKGSVVWRHVPGNFIVYNEQSFRAMIASMSPAEVVYELTHVHSFEEFPGCLIRALDDGVLINHPSEPTLAARKSTPEQSSCDVTSRDYLREVAEAIGDDRYSLVATRDIERGQELNNDYTADDACPAYYDALCEQYGVSEDFLHDR